MWERIKGTWNNLKSPALHEIWTYGYVTIIASAVTVGFISLIDVGMEYLLSLF